MISRTFRTRIPNSSCPNWKVRYLPDRSSAELPVLTCLSSATIDGIVLLYRSDIERKHFALIGHGFWPVSWPERDAEQDIIPIPTESLYNPFRPGTLGFEVAAKYNRGNTQSQRTQMTLQVAFQVADDHIGQLRHRVQHLFGNGIEIGHQHLGADAAGRIWGARQAAGSGPGPGDADERHNTIGHLRGAFFHRHVLEFDVSGEHGGKHFRNRVPERTNDQILHVHSGCAGSRIPASFSFIWSAVKGFRT